MPAVEGQPRSEARAELRTEPSADVRVAVAAAALLGESPVWHPAERALYYCDIPGHRLHRFDPLSGALKHWQFETDVASLAPMLGGALLLAMRDGLWRFDPSSGERARLAEYSSECAMDITSLSRSS